MISVVSFNLWVRHYRYSQVLINSRAKKRVSLPRFLCPILSSLSSFPIHSDPSYYQSRQSHMEIEGNDSIGPNYFRFAQGIWLLNSLQNKLIDTDLNGLNTYKKKILVGEMEGCPHFIWLLVFISHTWSETRLQSPRPERGAR